MNYIDDDEEIRDVGDMSDEELRPAVPPAPTSVHPGYRYVPRPADRWRVPTGPRLCRFIVRDRHGRTSCHQPAVAEMNRYRQMRTGKRDDSWWPYCETHTHTYHRWVVGDRVLEWHLVEIGEETA